MSLRVVVVDDDQVVTRVLRANFRSMPSVEIVATATDGNKGVAAVASTQPDVVILDLNMPGLSGLSAVAKVREAAPDAAIYAFTSFSAVHYRLLELGATQCFSKTEIEALLDEVERLAVEKNESG